MQRFLSFLVFLMFSNAAMAEWVLINSGDELDSYIDATSIRKNGNLAKMWILIDYKTGQDNGDDVYLSIKAQQEYDCRNETERSLAFVSYSGNMGSGKSIILYKYKEHESPASPIVPGSIGEYQWKLACGK